MIDLLLTGPAVGAHSNTLPAAFFIMLLVVALLGWSFRVLGRTLSELLAMFKILANVALTAVLLVGTLVAMFAWLLTSVAGR
jgi:hypothetical protein